MALVLCGLLGWDLSYEYQKPDLVAVDSTTHPVVHSIKHLIAPAYVPPQTVGTGTATTSTPIINASSTVETASSTPTQNASPATSTSINLLRRLPLSPTHDKKQ